MNAKLFSTVGAIAMIAAASVAAQSTMSPDDMAKAEHNDAQTPSTVPGNGPGSPRVGASATAPVVNNVGSSDTPPEDTGRMHRRARHNASQTPTTVPGASGSARVGATATAPVVNSGDPSTPH